MSPKGKILIIDDEELFLCTTSTMLEREGYSCACASNVATVEELTAQETYDLVIADTHMPGNTQLEIIQRLRESIACLPVILVTGSPSLDSALRAISLQVAAYLVKPFDVCHLLSTVRDLFTRTKAQRTVLDLQRRWQVWSKELHEFAAATPPDALRTDQTLEAMLGLSLQNLSRCFTDLQDLRTVFNIGLNQSSALKPLVESGTSPGAISQFTLPLQQSASFEARPNSKGIPAELLIGLQQLSRREREVLRLLLSNHRPRTIAQTLFISLYTVRNHLRSIFEKFAVHSQAELLTLLGQYTTYVDLQDAV